MSATRLLDHDRRIAVLRAVKQPTERQRAELLRLEIARDSLWRALPRRIDRLRHTLRTLETYAAKTGVPV